MIARLQRGLLLTLAVFLAAWGGWVCSPGSPAWSLLPGALLIGGPAWVLAIEFIWMAFANRRDPAPGLSAVLWVRAWALEVRSSVTVFGWTQPFLSHRWPDRLAGPPGKPGLVLIHGFFCNRGVWSTWMRRCHALGIPFVSVTLEPPFTSIDDYVHQVEGAMKRIEQATGCPPVVVAHSMGGLVARAWWVRCGRPGRVRRVLTLGSPHHGTSTARWGHGRNAAQMRRGSDWLRDLASSEVGHPVMPVTCFYSHADNIVFPASTACMPKADNRHLLAVGHVHMVDHAEVWSEALRWLEASQSAHD